MPLTYDPIQGRASHGVPAEFKPNAAKQVSAYHAMLLAKGNAMRRTGGASDWDTDGGGVYANAWTRMSFPASQITGDMYRAADFTFHPQVEGRYLAFCTFMGEISLLLADGLQIDKVELDLVVHRQGLADVRVPLDREYGQRQHDYFTGLDYTNWMYAWALNGWELIEHKQGYSYSFQWRYNGGGFIDTVDGWVMRAGLIRVTETPVFKTECCG